jgi:hypothetical protein
MLLETVITRSQRKSDLSVKVLERILFLFGHTTHAHMSLAVEFHRSAPVKSQNGKREETLGKFKDFPPFAVDISLITAKETEGYFLTAGNMHRHRGRTLLRFEDWIQVDGDVTTKHHGAESFLRS